MQDGQAARALLLVQLPLVPEASEDSGHLRGRAAGPTSAAAQPDACLLLLQRPPEWAHLDSVVWFLLLTQLMAS